MLERLGRTRHTRADHHRKIDELVDAVNGLIEVVQGQAECLDKLASNQEKITAILAAMKPSG